MSKLTPRNARLVAKHLKQSAVVIVGQDRKKGMPLAEALFVCAQVLEVIG